MGKKSPRLANREEAVQALFGYAKQQSGMTQIEIERRVISEYRQSKNKEGNPGAAPGKQWSRWENGHTLPELGLVRQLFGFCVEKLISGEWKENGQEAAWADLRDAVSDDRTVSLARHRFALKLAYSSLNAPSVITKEKIRGIEVGYYMPPAEEIHRLFFMTLPNTPDNALHRTDRAITFKDDIERNALEVMLKEIETNYGENEQDKMRLAKFNRQWGLIDDGSDWVDQFLVRMQEDVAVLSEIAERLGSLDRGLGTTMGEVQIGSRIKQEAMNLQKIIDAVAVPGSKQRIVWKNDIFFFNVRLRGLNGSQQTRYLSVVEIAEKDHAGRLARDLHPHLFAPIP